MKTFLCVSAMLAGATLVTGCASMQPQSDVRVDMAETGLPSCQSFTWIPTAQQPASFTEQRVQREVMAKLKEKGYSEAPKETANCRVTYVLDVHEVPKSKPSVGVGAGGGSGGIGGGIGVSLPIGKRKGQSGTFTIDVVDAAKNAQVWSGSLDASFAKAELNEDEIRSVVAEVLESFPDRK
ncbi:MAG: DUF4136 domain-containing protein [Steroidobacter sp.]